MSDSEVILNPATNRIREAFGPVKNRTGGCSIPFTLGLKGGRSGSQPDRPIFFFFNFGRVLRPRVRPAVRFQPDCRGGSGKDPDPLLPNPVRNRIGVFFF